jgi:hypothetical protein
MGKQDRVQFKTATHKTEGILDYIHSNVLMFCVRFVFLVFCRLLKENNSFKVKESTL